MNFVFTERIVNIVPAHRVYEEVESNEQLSMGNQRKLTRKTKVLTVNSTTSKGKQTVAKGAHVNKQDIKDVEEHGKIHGKEGGSRHTEPVIKAPIAFSGKKSIGKSKVIERKESNKSKTANNRGRNVTGVESTIMGNQLEEEIIRTKLLAQKEKEKSLEIQKYIQEGKKKRLASLRAGREQKEAQRLELQKKLNALNDYRRSKFKVFSPLKIKENLDSESIEMINQELDQQDKDTLRDTVKKVEYDVSFVQDYSESGIERVSNISHQESSSTITDDTNKRIYKTLMVNIEMIKARIEQLANKSSSGSSISEAVDSASVSMSQMEKNSNSSLLLQELPVSSPEKVKEEDIKVKEEDILDEPHISFLIKEFENKSRASIADNSDKKDLENKVLNHSLLTDDIFIEKYDADTLLLSNFGNDLLTDRNSNVKEERMESNSNVKEEGIEILEKGYKVAKDPVWSMNEDDSILISDFANSKDLVDESMIFDDDKDDFLKDVSEIDSDQIGIGSLSDFTKKAKAKVEDKNWVTSDAEELNVDYDQNASIFNILAKKLLSQTASESISIKHTHNMHTGYPHQDNNNLSERIQLSRKRRISATDSSFEVLPKKSHVGGSDQLRVLEIFQKKFIAKRHSPNTTSDSEDLYSIDASRGPTDISSNQFDINSQKEPDDSQAVPNIENVAGTNEKAENMLLIPSISSGYDDLDDYNTSLGESDVELTASKIIAEKPSSAEKLKSNLYDEPAATCSTSANSSFSDKISKGHIGFAWRPDSKKRLMDPRYRLSPSSLVEKYDAEISLSEVIELSLNQVESMAQGRKIAIAQEETINLRKMIEKRIPESETIANFDVKIGDASETKADLDINNGNAVDLNKKYESSFESISTESNVKVSGVSIDSSILSEYSINRDKAAIQVGSFSRPLMTEGIKFRILSTSDLMERSIKEILDYKEQAKIFFQQEFVWLNMRERAVDFRYTKEQKFYEHERKRAGKKDKERGRLILENEQAIEMKLVADKEDIFRQRQKIRHRSEEVNLTIETVLGKLSSMNISEKSDRNSKLADKPTDAIDEDLPDFYNDDDISAKVSNILGMSKNIVPITKKQTDLNNVPVQSNLKFQRNVLQNMNDKPANKNTTMKSFQSDYIEENIAEEIEEEAEEQNTQTNLYENDEFEDISEISTDLKQSKASILNMLRASPITEVMEAAEKIKKLNEENEKRKLWLAENMRKQEFRLKEESKILVRAVDDLSRYIKETDSSNDALKSAFNATVIKNSTGVISNTTINPTMHDDKEPRNSEISEIITEEISEASSYKEDVSLAIVVPNENDQLNISLSSNNGKPPSTISNDTRALQDMDISAIEAQYTEDFEPIDEAIIEEMVEDLNQELIDKEILKNVKEESQVAIDHEILEMNDEPNIRSQVSEMNDEADVSSAVIELNDEAEIKSEVLELNDQSEISDVVSKINDEAEIIEKSEELDKTGSTVSQVDMITDAIWATLLADLCDTVHAVSITKEKKITGPSRVSAPKKNGGVINSAISKDHWTLSDEMPIETAKEIMTKILDLSLSVSEAYDCPIALNLEIIHSLIPSNASNRRREECDMLFDLVKESLDNVFLHHLNYYKKVSQGQSHAYLRPQDLSKEMIVKKSLDYCLSCLTYSLENGENLDSLLIQEVKDEERTWKTLEKTMNIELKEKISLYILEEIIMETTHSIYQLYKDVF